MATRKERPQVDMKNTKAEMNSAYTALLAKYNDLATQKLDPAKVKKTKAVQETKAKASGITLDKVGSSIETLRNRANGALDNLRSEMEAELSNLDVLKQMIVVQNDEIQELYGISAEGESLAALIEAQAVKKAEYEADIAAKREAFAEEMAKARASWEEEKSEWKKAKTRENDEWKYTYERTKRGQVDALQDQLAAERKAWQAQKEADTKILDGREEDLTKREDEMIDLRAKVADFPAQLEAAVADGKKKASQSHGIEINAIKKSHDADVRVLEANVANLTGDNADLKVQVQSLDAKLEAAYGKVQDVAVQALNAQGNQNTTAEVQKAVQAATAGKR
jgi:hypothetical protein